MDELLLSRIRCKRDHDGDLQLEVLDVFGEECQTVYLSPAEVGQLIDFWKRHAVSASDTNGT